MNVDRPQASYEHSKFSKSVLEAGHQDCHICFMLCRHFDADLINQPADELNLTYTIFNNPAYTLQPDPDNFINFNYMNVGGEPGSKFFEIFEQNGM